VKDAPLDNHSVTAGHEKKGRHVNDAVGLIALDNEEAQALNGGRRQFRPVAWATQNALALLGFRNEPSGKPIEHTWNDSYWLF
jgi:hypothetical protein